MKTYKKLFAIILSILIIFTMFPLSYAATYGTTYTPDSNGIQITVSNLTANPDTDVLPDEKCKIDFDWKVEFIEMQQWFKAGDKVEIPMNFNSVFNFNGGWSYPVYTSEDEEIAKFYAEKDKFVIEFNENVEGKMLTALKGSYLNYYELPMTKNMDINNDTPYTIKVGNAETNVTFAGGKYLEVKSRGNGDAKIKGHPAFIKVNEGQNIEIEGYPYSGEVLESVVLTKADGTEATLSAKKNKISISSDALLNGKNKVVFNFSEKQSHPGSGTPMNEWRWNAKQHWGNDKDKNGFDTKVRFSIELNYQALLGLYQSEGESLEHPGFGNNGAIDNLYFEDTLPGGSTAKFTSPGSNLPKVYARLAQYTTAKNTLGNTVTFPVDMQEGGHLQQTDLISSGILTRLTPSTGETLNVFRKRVKSVPLTWGIYLDNTGNSTFMVNMGSPGNPDGPAVKATDLWPDVLEKDSKLNKLNGAGNCVKGNVQAFRIDFYGDYTDNLYTMTNLINSGKCSYISDKGKKINDTLKSSKYNVPGKNSLAIPSKGGILIVKADTFKDHAISGAEFKVQKKDKNGDWKDYVNTTHNVVKGITDDEGQLLLNGLIPGEYRLIETSVPKPYDKNSSNYLTLQGNPITEDGTFTIKPDQESGSIVKVTNTKKFNITYHGNGGKGTLMEY